MGRGNVVLRFPYRSECRQRKRNWILRMRYGPLWKSYTENLPESDTEDELVVRGQSKVMSTYMRLPNLIHDIPVHKRNNTTGKISRITDGISVTRLGNSTDNSPLGRIHSEPVEHSHKSSISDALSPATSVLPTRSIEVRIPQTTERLDLPRRRWSDGGSSFSETISDGYPPQNKSLARSLTLSSRSLNIVKSDPCVTQNAEELLNEFKEFAKRKDMQRDDSFVRSVRVLRNPGGVPRDPRQLAKHLYQNSTSCMPTKEANQRSKRQRRRTNKQLVQKQKRRGLMMPSGDSSRNKGTHSDKLYSPTNPGSGSTLRLRRGSRMATSSREVLFQRPYQQTENSHKKGHMAHTLTMPVYSMRNAIVVRACFLLKSSSRGDQIKDLKSRVEGPVVPTEEELKEMHSLPVIRKFLKMPESRPKVVCFDYPGVDLTHMDVKRAIERAVPDAFDSGKVVSIQFENVNVKLATGGLDNRWLIELQDFTTRNRLIKNGLTIDKPDRNSITDLKIKVPTWAEEHGEDTDDRKRDVEIIFPPIHYPSTVQVKLNDVVSMEEYKLYLRRTAAKDKLQNVALLCAGRGDKLLTTLI